MQEESKGTERNVMNKKNTVKMEHLKYRSVLRESVTSIHYSLLGIQLKKG